MVHTPIADLLEALPGPIHVCGWAALAVGALDATDNGFLHHRLMGMMQHHSLGNHYARDIHSVQVCEQDGMASFHVVGVGVRECVFFLVAGQHMHVPGVGTFE